MPTGKGDAGGQARTTCAVQHDCFDLGQGDCGRGTPNLHQRHHAQDHIVVHSTEKGDQLTAVEVKTGAMTDMSGMKMEGSTTATPHYSAHSGVATGPSQLPRPEMENRR
jgi:hypothetical protein